jgi:hypothetical protein
MKQNHQMLHYLETTVVYATKHQMKTVEWRYSYHTGNQCEAGTVVTLFKKVVNVNDKLDYRKEVSSSLRQDEIFARKV